MSRIIRIALIALVPMVAAAAFAGCDDDTAPTVQDLTVTVRDLAVPPDLTNAEHD